MADLEREVTRKIMVQVQCKDFGRVDEYGTFAASAKLIDLLEQCCTKAARAALTLVRREMLEETAKAVCPHCADGDIPMNYGDPFTMHHKHVEQGRFPSYSPCQAVAIRSLSDKDSGDA